MNFFNTESLKVELANIQGLQWALRTKILAVHITLLQCQRY